MPPSRPVRMRAWPALASSGALAARRAYSSRALAGSPRPSAALARSHSTSVASDEAGNSATSHPRNVVTSPFRPWRRRMAAHISRFRAPIHGSLVVARMSRNSSSASA